MTSFNDVTIVCSIILAGKLLCIHRRTTTVCLCTCRHPRQITIYYGSLESHRLFSKPIFMPVTYINTILNSLPSRKYSEAIMDDLLLFTPGKKAHLAKLEDLLRALRKNGLKISP